jgi:hypothetical protein
LHQCQTLVAAGFAPDCTKPEQRIRRSVLSLANFFYDDPYRNAARAVNTGTRRAATHDTGKAGFEMEKWLVVAAIWSMCAVCAILFIRGATCSVSRVPAEARRSRDQIRDAVRE